MASCEAISVMSTPLAGLEAVVTGAVGNGSKKDAIVAAVVEAADAGLTTGDVKEAIEWAADQGFSLEDAAGLLEGAEATGAFDKHDIKDWVLEMCEEFEITEDKADKMLQYAAEAFGISEAEGNDLIKHLGETFDISQAEFEETTRQCFVAGDLAITADCPATMHFHHGACVDHATTAADVLTTVVPAMDTADCPTG